MNKFKGLTSTLLLTGFMIVFSASVFAAEYRSRGAEASPYLRSGEALVPARPAAAVVAAKAASPIEKVVVAEDPAYATGGRFTEPGGPYTQPGFDKEEKHSRNIVAEPLGTESAAAVYKPGPPENDDPAPATTEDKLKRGTATKRRLAERGLRPIEPLEAKSLTQS